MPGLSIHVVDVSRGLVAQGLRVEIARLAPSHATICAGLIDERGLLDEPKLSARFEAGVFEARFHLGAFYRAHGVMLPDPAFLEIVHYHFGIADPDAHYHLPLKMTPWGYSCFRGGA
ncbi:MAG: hydroxyisourate hydrolase [Burkholderiales bacterium]